MVHSIAGQLSGGRLSDRRPFRTPHHSATMAALIGGGLRAKPGEASLAHHGVLFLDEFPEFAPQVLDALRQPLETGECIIARRQSPRQLSRRNPLVAAMNPCRCGMAGEPRLYLCPGSALRPLIIRPASQAACSIASTFALTSLPFRCGSHPSSGVGIEFDSCRARREGAPCAAGAICDRWLSRPFAPMRGARQRSSKICGARCVWPAIAARCR